jgi:hypothetical protein
LFLACLKFQCLSIIKNNKTICECANRRVPCDKNLNFNIKDNCENQSAYPSAYLKISDGMSTFIYIFLMIIFILGNEFIDCSNIICKTASINTSICPSDSHFIEDHTPLLRTSFPLSKSLSSICCESRGHCVCSSCPKTICGENSIIQIYRTGNPHHPGQCCDQFNCIKSR